MFSVRGKITKVSGNPPLSYAYQNTFFFLKRAYPAPK